MSFQNSIQNGQANAEASRVPDNIRSMLVVVVAGAGLVGLAFGAMTLLTSPDGWVMKAANQAMTTAVEGTLASYTLADSQ